MIDMIKKDICPAVCKYMSAIATTINEKQRASRALRCELEINLLNRLSENSDNLNRALKTLEKDILKAENVDDITERAHYYRDTITPDMESARRFADNLEEITAKEYWPFPTYTDILYSVVG